MYIPQLIKSINQQVQVSMVGFQLLILSSPNTLTLLYIQVRIPVDLQLSNPKIKCSLFTYDACLILHNIIHQLVMIEKC